MKIASTINDVIAAGGQQLSAEELEQIQGGVPLLLLAAPAAGKSLATGAAAAAGLYALAWAGERAGNATDHYIAKRIDQSFEQRAQPPQPDARGSEGESRGPNAEAASQGGGEDEQGSEDEPNETPANANYMTSDGHAQYVAPSVPSGGVVTMTNIAGTAAAGY